MCSNNDLGFTVDLLKKVNLLSFTLIWQNIETPDFFEIIEVNGITVYVPCHSCL